MLHTNASNFRKNLFSILDQTITYNEPVNISTKQGNVIMLSEEDYRGVMTTLELLSNPEMKAKLNAGMACSLEDCVPDSEVLW